MYKTTTRKQYALEASDHVAYEMDLFLFSMRELLHHRKANNVHNAFLESFAVHFRNLYIFFCTNKITKHNRRDIYYMDFYCVPEKSVEVLSIEKNKANKGIAHIDRGRTILKDNPWNFEKIYNVFKPLIKRFVDDPDILSNIKKKHLINEINEYIKVIDTLIQNSSFLNICKTDTTSGPVSESTVQING